MKNIQEYNSKEFAELIQVSQMTLRNWDKTGKFPARRKTNGRKFYTDADYNSIVDGDWGVYYRKKDE